MRCATPVLLGALVDYWAGDATTEEAERLEEHVFACDSCARRLAAVAGLAQGVALVAAIRGGIGMVLTQALVAQLAADGLKMRHYHPQHGESIRCTIGPDDDLSITYLSADLRDVRRVDVVSYVQTKEWARIVDAPIDRVAGQVIYAVGGDLARTFPSITVRVELVAFGPDGDTKVLGNYIFEHTPLAT